MPPRKKGQKMVGRSRKDMRKEMRLEKKQRQKDFFKKRRENKLNHLKSKKVNDGNSEKIQSKHRKLDLAPVKGKFVKPKSNHSKENNNLQQQKSIMKMPKIIEPGDSDFEDEEIDSDEFLSGSGGSDDEVSTHVKNSKNTANQKKKTKKKIIENTYEDKILQAREKEQDQLRAYEDGLHQHRVEQLEAANKEEDKVISKYEKLLKINRRKGKKEVPMSFNDGLDYILELCTQDNIQKMYNAAKEAADLEEDSSDESTKAVVKKSKKDSNKHMERLKKVEEKYFGDDKDPDNMLDLEDLLDDGMDSDDDFDEPENDDEQPKIKTKNGKKVSFKEESVIKEADSDGNSDFDLLDSDEDMNSDDEIDSENDENVKTTSNGFKKRSLEEDEESELANLFKNKKKKNYVMAPPPDDLSEEEENEPDSNDELAELFKNQKKSTNSVSEDIYGRKRDSHGNIVQDETEVTKYIPPHLRNQNLSEAVDPKKQEQLIRLKKQLKGQLNRLAEANMQRIAIDIENLYMQNPRHDMNTTLADLILAALVSNMIANERMVLEHMLLLAVLHANIGSEIGAFFLEQIVQKFNSLFANIENLQVENKELDNFIFILCHMYTYKLFQHNLIYDVLEKLTKIFNEKSVECILLILKSVGFSLRKDDPLALKDLVIQLQKKANDNCEAQMGNVRVKFMLDILLAIKNNNMSKIPNYDPSLYDHFRKLLKSFTHAGKYITTLNITMDDILNADKHGKWWLVGSAWSGNEIKGETANRNVKSTGEFSAQLLELARKQRMNTDDRRNVFCIIMSAEDYIDAFDKLLHLGIKDPRVIVTVIIHCCLSEKQFNPYYAVLAQKFTDHDRKYHQAFQYGLWDRIKDISSLTQIQIKNLASFLIHLIQQGGLPLSVIKVIEFSELDKITHKFVKQIMIELLLSKDDVFSNVFSRVAPSPKLKSFKDSLKLFMHHFLLSNATQKKLDEDKYVLLEKRVCLVDKLFQSGDQFVSF